MSSPRKQMSDADLERLGSLYCHMLVRAVEAWELAMRCMLINGQQYREICRSGKSIQKIYLALRDKAIFEHKWEKERVDSVFTTLNLCGFG